MDIRSEIYKTIEIIVNSKLQKMGFNYCVTGVITAVNSDGTYSVKILDNIYQLKSISNQTYVVGDVVYVLVINNDFSKKFVLCKAS